MKRSFQQGALALFFVGCSGGSPSEAPRTEEAEVPAPVVPAHELPAHAPPVPTEVVLEPGSVGALPAEGETDLLVCTLDAALVGDASSPATGSLAFRSDGVLFVVSHGALRAFDVEEGRDCRLRAHTSFGDGGALAIAGLDPIRAQLVADAAGHVFLGDGTSVIRIDRVGDVERVTPPLSLSTDQLTARPSGDFALARVGHMLVRITGEETLTHAPESLGLTARDVTDVHFVDDGTLLFRRAPTRPHVFVHLDGSEIAGRTLTSTEATGPIAVELVRAATNGALAVAGRGPEARVLLFAPDGAFVRAVGVGSSVDFALEVARPAEGPSSLTGLSSVRDRVAYASFDVVRGGVHEGEIVRISGL